MNVQKAVIMSISTLASIGIGVAAASLTTNRNYNKAESSATQGVTSKSGVVLYAPYGSTVAVGDLTAAGSSAASAAEPESATVANYEYSYAGFNPRVANTQNRNLILVNGDYILPDDYEVNLQDAVSGYGIQMDAVAAPHYQEMYNAALKDGITLTPVSGYRSVSHQRTNFENKIQSYIDQGYSEIKATQMAAERILPPGTSEHNAGLAMDICVASVDAHFENSAEYAWLSEHAADYGFILRYPEEKKDITKITYEPWHWRYVGLEDAKKIKASGQCLEEYLGY